MHIALIAADVSRVTRADCGSRSQIVPLLEKGLRKKGIDVALFVSAQSCLHPRANLPGGASAAEMIPPPVTLSQSMNLAEIFSRGDEFDVIHNHSGSLAVTYSGLTGTPTLTTVPNVTLPDEWEIFKKYDGRTFYVSAGDFQHSSELHYLGTEPPCIAVEDFVLDKSGGGYLVFLDRIHPDTCAKRAVEIAALSGSDLVLAGPIQDEHYFQEIFGLLLPRQNVRYAGEITADQRSLLLGGARGLLHPVESEQHPACAILWANACGTPVVAFESASTQDLVENGMNGFVVANTAEAVEAVGKLDTLSRSACREFVEQQFSPDRMVDAYVNFYRHILNLTKREEHRPWGYYEVLLDKPNHKVKEIVVFPGKRLSLQRHKYRYEHWMIISGSAMVTRDESQILLGPGESVNIPAETKHRVLNPGEENLVFIEVQTGSYFGEDDIERFEDDFGRA
ncbi:MAG TPA: cupin domain-containing protein [Desulfomonilaceae bacterium]|nr:cupin domain-containing protein [Desulfomonilaceae bacterium]